MANKKAELPDKCRSCSKTSREDIFSDCRLCHDLSFPEHILCDLNRSIQSSGSEFVCHAFQPLLKLVSSEKTPSPVLAGNNQQQDPLVSDKTKYTIALHLQKMGKDPDLVYALLKYHIVWNVFYREKMFSEPSDSRTSIFTIFDQSIKQNESSMSLPLLIAPDHVHVYVETNGKISIDQIIWQIKKATEQKLIGILRDLNIKDSKSQLWDDAYFVETIG